jgi:cytochrome c-type biogenesis protein CcmE
MSVKIVVASLVIVVGLIFGAVSFVESNIEYADFQTAMATHKKLQVKGEWLRDQESHFDARQGQFIFHMQDENGTEMKVIYDGARPNNFEIADAIVVKGRYQDGSFHASEILTKCPSKYEGDAGAVKKTL